MSTGRIYRVWAISYAGADGRKREEVVGLNRRLAEAVLTERLSETASLRGRRREAVAGEVVRGKRGRRGRAVWMIRYRGPSGRVRTTTAPARKAAAERLLDQRAGRTRRRRGDADA